MIDLGIQSKFSANDYQGFNLSILDNSRDKFPEAQIAFFYQTGSRLRAASSIGNP